jgi:pyridoxal phosphate enzyme (YggS family)
MSVAANLGAISERISRAAQRCGRNPDDIRLMAVTKTQPPERIIEAYRAGQRLFGENRVQEFADKQPALAQLADAEKRGSPTRPAVGIVGLQFHMIGHLQSNKAGKAAELFCAVDSLDSFKLADRLNAAGEKLSRTLEALIEINVGGELAKSGIAPDSPGLEQILAAAPTWPYLRIHGLMTVPPFTEDPEGARPYFRRLRELRDRIAARQLPSVKMNLLSMGMSHDFEVAIEEGSTCVRIGTAIFGTRANP